MIGVIKYRAGNLASVSNALDRLRAEYLVTDDTDRLEMCDAVIFPGVGHAAAAMEDLRSRNLDSWLAGTTKPLLGICLGMQLLYESTEEGDCRTLGVIPGRLRKFDPRTAKVPHMGWNSFTRIEDHPLTRGLEPGHFLYFVHGYYAPVNRYTLASCDYINDFAAIAARDNFMGVQFHPEKSGKAGSLILKNFLTIVQNRINFHT